MAGALPAIGGARPAQGPRGRPTLRQRSRGFSRRIHQGPPCHREQGPQRSDLLGGRLGRLGKVFPRRERDGTRLRVHPRDSSLKVMRNQLGGRSITRQGARNVSRVRRDRSAAGTLRVLSVYLAEGPVPQRLQQPSVNCAIRGWFPSAGLHPTRWHSGYAEVDKRTAVGRAREWSRRVERGIPASAVRRRSKRWRCQSGSLMQHGDVHAVGGRGVRRSKSASRPSRTTTYQSPVTQSRESRGVRPMWRNTSSRRTTTGDGLGRVHLGCASLSGGMKVWGRVDEAPRGRVGYPVEGSRVDLGSRRRRVVGLRRRAAGDRNQRAEWVVPAATTTVPRTVH